MTGAALLSYVKERLGLTGVTVEAGGPFGDTSLFDAITDARDTMRQVMALAAPVAVRKLVTLLVDPGDDRIYTLPTAEKDPYSLLELRAVTTRERLRPASEIDQDLGEYETVNLRKIRLAEHVNPPGGLEGYYVVREGDDPIGTGTTEPNVGLPTTLHRATGKLAAHLALTRDEGSDATQAERLFLQELDRLDELYSEFDNMGGVSLREAFLASYGEQYGDMLS